jgi:hypothetical protein
MRRLFPWVAPAALLLGIAMLVADTGPTAVWAAVTAVAFVLGIIDAGKSSVAGHH